MATNHVMAYCATCKKQTDHLQPATAHVLHLLLSVITLGVWIPVWLLVGSSNSSQRTCSVCASEKGLFGTTRAPASVADTKKCPFCAELIKREAIKCRFCSADLPAASAAPAPQPGGAYALGRGLANAFKGGAAGPSGERNEPRA